MDPRARVEPRNHCHRFASASSVHEVFCPLDVFGFASAQPPPPVLAAKCAAVTTCAHYPSVSAASGSSSRWALIISWCPSRIHFTVRDGIRTHSSLALLLPRQARAPGHIRKKNRRAIRNAPHGRMACSAAPVLGGSGRLHRVAVAA